MLYCINQKGVKHAESLYPSFHLLGRRQANLCFHFAGSGENLPDITKSRDASLDNKELYSFT